MKKIAFKILVIALLGVFTLIGGSNPALAENKRGGVLKIATDKAGTGFFGIPLKLKGQDSMYSYHCLQKLLRLAEEGGTMVPRLAKSWELAPDEKSYIFKLRKGVKFHDGTDFNAQAVKWNMDNLLKHPRPIPTNVTSMDIIDDYTVRLNFSSWSSMILNDLALDHSCLIISPTAYEKNGEKWARAHPVGTGAFKLKEIKRNQYVEYERFDDYWEKGLPYLDGFQIVMIHDQMTRIAALKAGEVHGIIYMDVPSATQVKAEGVYNLFVGPGVSFSFFFNSKDPNSYFADKRVRHAVEYAIDREKIANSLGVGFTLPINTIIPAGPEVPDKLVRKYNPNKARKLLAEAGYPNGFKVDLMAPTFAPRDFLGAVQDYLAKVGIDIKLQFNTYPAQQALSVKGGLGNNLLYGKIPGLKDVPLYSAKYSLSSSSPWNMEMARTPGFDDLIEQALVEKDPDKKRALLHQMEKLAYDDAMHIPLWIDSHLGAFDPSIHDYKLWLWHSACHDFSRAWISKK